MPRRRSRPDLLVSPSDELRRAALAARERQRAMHKHGPGPLGHAHKPVEEHYHIVYHVPKENISIPYFRDIFTTSRDAYVKIHEIGQNAEPQTEWYEDGEIGFETHLPGRMGLYWVVLEITGCVRRSCSQFMNREQRKRRFILLPDDAEAVPLET